MELTVPIKVELDEEKMRKVIEKYVEEHDVVEVVRCIDCKWYNHGYCDKLDKITENEHYRVKVEKDEYCSKEITAGYKFYVEEVIE